MSKAALRLAATLVVGVVAVGWFGFCAGSGRAALSSSIDNDKKSLSSKSSSSSGNSSGSGCLAVSGEAPRTSL